MASRKVIALDLDGVLADYNSGFRRVLALMGAELKEFGPSGDPHLWNWYGPYGASASQTEAALTHVNDNPFFWADLGPHRDLSPEVVDLVQQLASDHELYVVTSRPRGMRGPTEDWLWFHLRLSCPVVMTPNSKIPALVSLAPDFLVEDHDANVIKYLETRPSIPCKGLLVRREYNKAGQTYSGLEAHDSTVEALRAIKGEAK